jgi:hypothetical protein
VGTLGGTAGLCVAGVIETVGAACLPLAGVLVYSGANWGNNALQGDVSPVDGWRWQDATITAATVTATTLVPAGVIPTVFAGAVIGAAQDIAMQGAKDPSHINLAQAACSGLTGAISGYLTHKFKMPDDADENGLSGKGIFWDAYQTFLGGSLCDTSFP